MKKHQHKWKMTSRCGSEISEKCECGFEREREATKSEKKRFAAQRKEDTRRTNEMNKIWWDFIEKFKDDNRNWKYEKYELMEKIERWAEKQDPEIVVFSGCDDTMFMSSDLLLVHHIWTDKEKRKNCWGTSVVLLTQDGQPPAEFFLYPGHTKELIDNLEEVWNIRERR